MILLTGEMLLSASFLISVDMVWTSSLMSFSSTVWFRTVTAAACNLCAADSVIHEISLAWLKCVCKAIALPALLAFCETSISALTQSSVGSTNRIGATASPLDAKRKRRMCGTASIVSEVYSLSVSNMQLLRDYPLRCLAYACSCSNHLL